MNSAIIEKTKVLIDKLDYFYTLPEDKRCYGEHPECSVLLEKIESNFNKMEDNEIKNILDGLAVDRLEQMVCIFDNLMDERGFLEPYLKKAML